MPVCHNSSHAAAAANAYSRCRPAVAAAAAAHRAFSLFTLHNFKVSVPTRLGCRQIAAPTTLPKKKLVCHKNVGA